MVVFVQAETTVIRDVWGLQFYTVVFDVIIAMLYSGSLFAPNNILFFR